MNLAVQSVSDMEMNIVSAERVEEFSESDSEVHKKLSFKHFICAEKWRHYYSWLDCKMYWKFQPALKYTCI